MELWRKNLYSVWSAQFIAGLGLNMVIPFLPLYLRDLGVDGDQSLKIWSGVVFSSAFMVSACMQPLWGILGDRVGRKPMIVRAMLGLGLAHILMGFAQNPYHLLLCRLFQGCFAGFLAPSLALVSSSAPEEKTGYALGTLQMALISSLILGPLLGGVLIHFMGARPIFFMTGALCFCGALVVLRFVEETFELNKERKKSGLRDNLRSVFYTTELRNLFFLLLLIQFSLFFVAPFLTLYVEFLGVQQRERGSRVWCRLRSHGGHERPDGPVLGSKGGSGRLPQGPSYRAHRHDSFSRAHGDRHRCLAAPDLPCRNGPRRVSHRADHQFPRQAFDQGERAGRNLWYLPERISDRQHDWPFSRRGPRGSYGHEGDFPCDRWIPLSRGADGKENEGAGHAYCRGLKALK